MRVNNIRNAQFGKIYKVTSNTQSPDPKKVNPDVFSAVIDARGVISGLGEEKFYTHDKLSSRELGEYLKAQIVDWDGNADGLVLKHIGDSDYMFTGADAEKFFRYRKESEQIMPETMLEEKAKEFLKNLEHSAKVLSEKIDEYNQEIDSIGVIPKPDDKARIGHLSGKRGQYIGELKVFQSHINAIKKCLENDKHSYQEVYRNAKYETMVESGNFDEISFRFTENGEISSVEFLNKAQ